MKCVYMTRKLGIGIGWVYVGYVPVLNPYLTHAVLIPNLYHTYTQPIPNLYHTYTYTQVRRVNGEAFTRGIC